MRAYGNSRGRVNHWRWFAVGTRGSIRDFIDVCVDEVVSIGDFVLSGGEIAAMALIDAVVRQLPGALKEASAADESFAAGLLDAQHYTRPESWSGIRFRRCCCRGTMRRSPNGVGARRVA